MWTLFVYRYFAEFWQERYTACFSLFFANSSSREWILSTFLLMCLSDVSIKWTWGKVQETSRLQEQKCCSPAKELLWLVSEILFLVDPTAAYCTWCIYAWVISMKIHNTLYMFMSVNMLCYKWKYICIPSYICVSYFHCIKDNYLIFTFCLEERKCVCHALFLIEINISAVSCFNCFYL